jgi:DnaJ-class molecular chaperone
MTTDQGREDRRVALGIDRDDCATCRGRGYVYLHNGCMVPCWRCHGTGRANAPMATRTTEEAAK